MNVKMKKKLGDKSKRRTFSQRWSSYNKKSSCRYLKRGVVTRPVHIPRRTRRGV